MVEIYQISMIQNGYILRWNKKDSGADVFLKTMKDVIKYLENTGGAIEDAIVEEHSKRLFGLEKRIKVIEETQKQLREENTPTA